MPWFAWVGIVIGGLLALWLIVMPLFTVCAALFEDRHVRAIAPASTPPVPKPAVQMMIDEAQLQGFRSLGVFSDGDKGWKEGFAHVLLSEDSRTLMVLHMNPLVKLRLITALGDDRWIVTCDFLGEFDLSGLNIEKMLPSKEFAVIYQYHLERIAEWESGIVPFDEKSFVDDLFAHEQLRVGRLIEQGKARAVDPSGDMWRYTLRGAITVGTASTLNIQTVGDAAKDADARGKQFKEAQAKVEAEMRRGEVRR